MSELFEPLEAVEEAVEELFPPKEGGLVDRHRKRIAAQKAAADEAENAGEAIEERSYRAVKVAVEQPETLATQTIVIAAGSAVQILPAYAYRKRAVISVWPTGASQTPVVAMLSKDQGGVVNMIPITTAEVPAPGNQFFLANGQILSIESRAQLWAGNPTDAAIAVSVYSEFYGPEHK